MTITATTLTDRKLAALRTPLARARATTPLSVREVAAAVGIGYGMLSEYESGYRLPSRATREALSAFYGMDITVLFPGSKAEAGR